MATSVSVAAEVEKQRQEAWAVDEPITAGFSLSGRLYGVFHLTGLTGEPSLMGSTEQQVEENPRVQTSYPLSSFPFHL